MTHDELFATFDRIRDGLLKQEQMRRRPGFAQWVEKARPAFTKYTDAVAAEPYGKAYCAFLDWADKKGLAWRGELKRPWPTAGPLVFQPPTMDGLLAEIEKVLGELDLVDATRRLARSSVAPTEKTRGGSGGKGRSQLTVRK